MKTQDVLNMVLIGGYMLMIAFMVWTYQRMDQWEHFGFKILQHTECKDLNERAIEAAKLLGPGYRP